MGQNLFIDKLAADSTLCKSQGLHLNPTSFPEVPVHNLHRNHTSGLSAPGYSPYRALLLHWRGESGLQARLPADQALHLCVRVISELRGQHLGQPRRRPLRAAASTFTPSLSDHLCRRRSPPERTGQVRAPFTGAVRLPPGRWLYGFGRCWCQRNLAQEPAGAGPVLYLILPINANKGSVFGVSDRRTVDIIKPSKNKPLPK